MSNDNELDNKLKETLSGLKQSLADLDSFSDGIEGTLKSVVKESQGNMSDMSNGVDTLWKASKDGTLYNSDDTDLPDGDIDDDDTYDTDDSDEYITDVDILDNIWSVVETTPNNMKLGKKIRELYRDYIIEDIDYIDDVIPDSDMTAQEREALDNDNKALMDEAFENSNPNQLELF